MSYSPAADMIEYNSITDTLSVRAANFSAPGGGGGGLFVEPDIVVQHVTSANVGGGALTSFEEDRRTLNTIIRDTTGVVAIVEGGTAFRLPTGRWYIRHQGEYYGTGVTKQYLTNLNGLTKHCIGNTVDCASSISGTSIGRGIIEISNSYDSIVPVYLRSATRAGSDSLGRPLNDANNIFVQIECWKVAA